MSKEFYITEQDEIERIGIQLKNRMAEKGINKTQLAEVSGLSRQTVLNVINGRTKKGFSPNTLQALCDALECDMSYLLGEIQYSTHDLKFICEYTGLTEKSVKKLHKAKDFRKPTIEEGGFVPTEEDLKEREYEKMLINNYPGEFFYIDVLNQIISNSKLVNKIGEYLSAKHLEDYQILTVEDGKKYSSVTYVKGTDGFKITDSAQVHPIAELTQAIIQKTIEKEIDTLFDK